MKTYRSFIALSLSWSLFISVVEGATGDQTTATSYTLTIPPEISAIANHLSNGGNTVAGLLPDVPEGTLLYKYDGLRQVFTVNQFQFGNWLQPEETLGPGEGALIRNPGEKFFLTFSGTKPSSPQFPKLNVPWTLVSLPVPGETSLPVKGGDSIFRFSASVQNYFIHIFDDLDLAWVPRLNTLPPFGNLMTNLGESFFYDRGYSSAAVDGTVYFNTYVPGAVDAQITWENGASLGPGFKAQLYGGPAGTPVEKLVPLLPQTTIQTKSAAASRHVNPVLDTMPGVPPNTMVTLFMRVFKGATYETSSVRGESDPITVRLGGSKYPPANLTGLPGLSFPVPPGTVLVERIANGLRLTYAGTLQSASAVTGPYADVVGAISPASITFNGTARYYRVKP